MARGQPFASSRVRPAAASARPHWRRSRARPARTSGGRVQVARITRPSPASSSSPSAAGRAARERAERRVALRRERELERVGEAAATAARAARSRRSGGGGGAAGGARRRGGAHADRDGHLERDAAQRRPAALVDDDAVHHGRRAVEAAQAEAVGHAEEAAAARRPRRTRGRHRAAGGCRAAATGSSPPTPRVTRRARRRVDAAAVAAAPPRARAAPGRASWPRGGGARRPAERGARALFTTASTPRRSARRPPPRPPQPPRAPPPRPPRTAGRTREHALALRELERPSRSTCVPPPAAHARRRRGLEPVEPRGGRSAVTHACAHGAARRVQRAGPVDAAVRAGPLRRARERVVERARRDRRPVARAVALPRVRVGGASATACSRAPSAAARARSGRGARRGLDVDRRGRPGRTGSRRRRRTTRSARRWCRSLWSSSALCLSDAVIGGGVGLSCSLVVSKIFIADSSLHPFFPARGSRQLGGRPL